MSEHTSSAPAKATSREWLGLAVIALPCMVYAMDMTVLNLAHELITIVVMALIIGAFGYPG